MFFRFKSLTFYKTSKILTKKKSGKKVKKLRNRETREAKNNQKK